MRSKFRGGIRTTETRARKGEAPTAGLKGTEGAGGNPTLVQHAVDVLAKALKETADIRSEKIDADKDSLRKVMQLSINEQFKRYDSGNMQSSDVFYFGKTANRYIEIGLEEKPLILTISDYKKSTKEKHGARRKTVKSTINAMENAIGVFYKGSEFGFITQELDKNYNNILIGIHGNSVIDRQEVNSVESYYGVEHPEEWIQNQLNAGKKFKTWDKEKTNEYLQAHGFQLSSAGEVIRLENNITQEKSDGNTKFSVRDSEGNTLTLEQQEYFKDSKVRDEDGNLRVVYHGTSESFNTFDMTKGRTNMDIRGSFFSPWEIDAGGYGENVRPYYLNITNPAPENIAYRALNKYKGQNNAGVKAREYLKGLGYDGVNNSDEEYIAFYPEQIKLIDNTNPTENPDIRYSLRASEDTQKVMNRLAAGENVSISEINNLEDIRVAKDNLASIKESFAQEHPEFANVSIDKVGTYLLNTEEREQLRRNILEERINSGSFSGFDENGKEVYNNKVIKDRRIDIVIGLPAAGKSTALVNPLSQQYKSQVIDSDIIKEMLPEFNHGAGADLVHRESSDINKKLLKASVGEGNNIVLPIVGANEECVKKYIDIAKQKNYSVYLHLNELPANKAMGRMLGRYFNTGRFLKPELIAEYGNGPTEVFHKLKGEADGYSEDIINTGIREGSFRREDGTSRQDYAGYPGTGREGRDGISGSVAGRDSSRKTEIDGYSRWSNDVAKGQRPILKDSSGISEADLGQLKAGNTRFSLRTDTREQTEDINGILQQENTRMAQQAADQKKRINRLIQQNNDLETEVANLITERQQLEAENSYLRGQFKKTERVIDETDLKKKVKRIIKDYDGTVNVDDVIGSFYTAANNFQKDPEHNWSQLKAAANGIANTIIDSAEVMQEYGEAVEVRRYLKDIKIPITAKIKADIPDYNSTRKSYFGRLNMTTQETGQTLEEVYSQLRDNFGSHLFPEEVTNPTDMLYQIMDVVDSDTYIFENPYSNDRAEAVDYVGNSSIIAGFQYDSSSGTLTVNLTFGRTYTYNVSKEPYEGFKNADSKGSYYNNYIKR